MPLQFVPETGAGLANATTYASLKEADDYHERRFYADVWKKAQPEEKKAALVWATKWLDLHANWLGDPSSTGQALRWPRTGVPSIDGNTTIAGNVLPGDVTDATAELARLHLEKDISKMMEEQNTTSKSTGGRSKSYGPRDRRRGAALPPSVIALIRHLIRRGSVAIVRT
jgi:hypothetical protein